MSGGVDDQFLAPFPIHACSAVKQKKNRKEKGVVQLPFRGRLSNTIIGIKPKASYIPPLRLIRHARSEPFPQYTSPALLRNLGSGHLDRAGSDTLDDSSILLDRYLHLGVDHRSKAKPATNRPQDYPTLAAPKPHNFQKR